MDISGFVGDFCDCDRGSGGNWMYVNRCGRNHFGIRMVEGFGFIQVGAFYLFMVCTGNRDSFVLGYVYKRKMASKRGLFNIYNSIIP